uniref:Uncharacterized protein n=1 Tax=Oryza glumipatula TaxID=40148 RepID=A0A0D9ZY19_9ORYZ
MRSPLFPSTPSELFELCLSLSLPQDRLPPPSADLSHRSTTNQILSPQTLPYSGESIFPLFPFSFVPYQAPPELSLSCRFTVLSSSCDVPGNTTGRRRRRLPITGAPTPLSSSSLFDRREEEGRDGKKKKRKKKKKKSLRAGSSII